MKFLLMIWEDDNDPVSNAPDVGPAYDAITAEMREQGVHLGGEALGHRDSARTVRVRGGNRLLMDGPFTETKEVLAGYMIVECKDLDNALAWAERLPTAKFGAIEVRPIV